MWLRLVGESTGIFAVYLISSRWLIVVVLSDFDPVCSQGLFHQCLGRLRPGTLPPNPAREKTASEDGIRGLRVRVRLPEGVLWFIRAIGIARRGGAPSAADPRVVPAVLPAWLRQRHWRRHCHSAGVSWHLLALKGTRETACNGSGFDLV